MRKKIFQLIILFLLPAILPAQQPAGPKPIRIMDSLTAKEKAERNPLLTRKELDSLVLQYMPPVQPVTEKEESAGTAASTLHPVYLGISCLLLLLTGFIAWQLVQQQKKLQQLSAGKEQAAANKPSTDTGQTKKNGKKQPLAAASEAKMEQLHSELNKLMKENEGLQGVIREYNGIRQDLDNISYAVQQAFKVRNYPGNEQQQKEAAAISTVLVTEKAVAEYAYTQFLKPLLLLTDANKNHPVKMSTADQQRVVELLISLSFLYIEYLYLRIPDLAVGGTMVQRLKALTSGAVLKEEWLKKLNRESGSRALVMRMALDPLSLPALSYPVFDETNLNPA